MTNDNPIKLVNRSGKIVGINPETGEEVPIELGETHLDSISSEDARIEERIGAPALGHCELARPTQEELGSDPSLIGAVDGDLYGVDNTSELFKSEDSGESWSLVQDTPATSTLRGIGKLGDDEVLVFAGEDALCKSSGWPSDPSTATWTSVLSAPDNTSFLYRCVDIVGSKVLATTYGDATEGDPIKVWLSTDNGDTFSEVLDLDDRTDRPEDAHMHFAEIDQYAGDRLWTAWHHTEGDPQEDEILYSDDDGQTWNVLSAPQSDDPQHGSNPTTATALPSGMVFGSDRVPEGVYRALRTDDPADMEYELLHRWITGVQGLAGFAQQAYHDAERDVAYIAFRVQNGPATGAIAAATARSANLVWQQPTVQTDSGTGAFFVAVSGEDRVVADVTDGSTEKRLFGDESWQGYYDPQALDTGNVLGGWASTRERQIAVGQGARFTDDGSDGRGFAAGHRATVRHDRSTAVGTDTESHFAAVAFGHKADAENWGVAVGDSSMTGSQDSVAIGASAEANSARGVAIGRDTSIDSSDQGRIGVEGLVFGGVEDTFSDADLNNSEVTFEIDEANSDLVVKVKDSDGNVLTGSVDLS